MKPKILSVKMGYNPNSSSVGMMVQIFMYQSLVISVLFSTIGFLVNLKKRDVDAVREQPAD